MPASRPAVDLDRILGQIGPAGRTGSIYLNIPRRPLESLGFREFVIQVPGMMGLQKRHKANRGLHDFQHIFLGSCS
jgi:hypothetical protein